VTLRSLTVEDAITSAEDPKLRQFEITHAEFTADTT
jgi:hypothetical protein